MRMFLGSRSLVYRNGPIACDAGDDFWSRQNGHDSAFLAAHVAEIRLCDAELNPGVPLGSRLMSWQVAEAGPLTAK